MERVGRAAIRAHEADLTAYAHERLTQIEGLRIYGCAPDKGPIVAFDMAAAHAHDIATVIDRSGVAVRAGTHCAMPLLIDVWRHLDLPRLLRALQHARRDRPAGRSARQEPGPFSPEENLVLRNDAPNTSEAELAAASNRTPQAVENERLTNDIVKALKTVYDPEIPADIYELGLIYRVDIADEGIVEIDMTLTAPGCPVAGEMPIWVKNAVSAVPGVSDVKVNMVFDPPWDQSRMSDEARVALDMW